MSSGLRDTYHFLITQQGDDVQVGDAPRSIPFYQVINEGQQELVIQLKVCREDQAPERYDPESKLVHSTNFFFRASLRLTYVAFFALQS
jgi:hypothetical protein